ncbi:MULTISPECIES: hypothetical protein [unclassified Pseudomonas]|uniref:hypothetical protein n=1 Tax=unclassified Pseudomonas TaxID=196821 RepID=UPI0030D9677A
MPALPGVMKSLPVGLLRAGTQIPCAPQIPMWELARDSGLPEQNDVESDAAIASTQIPIGFEDD